MQDIEIKSLEDAGMLLEVVAKYLRGFAADMRKLEEERYTLANGAKKNSETWLTVKDAAEALGTTAKSIYYLKDRYGYPFQNDGEGDGTLLVRLEDYQPHYIDGARVIAKNRNRL
jgi:hypothetical protein